jgi:hypothetical protein
MRTNKYKAKSVYYLPGEHRVIFASEVNKTDIATKKYYFFPSLHELNVYLALLPLLEKGYTIKNQSPIELIKPNELITYPNGRYWVADFVLSGNSGMSYQMVIEAKGVMTKDFVLLLALLEQNNKQAFDNLWLVFSSIPKQNRVIQGLLKTPMKDRIHTLTTFKRWVSLRV